MKKLLLTLAILGGIGLFTVPVFATTAVPWSIKNVTDTFFNPSTFNGNNLRLLVGTTTEPTTATYNDLIDAASSTNDFISIGVWNQSSGNCATSEYDANSNASTLTNNFTALGITGGGFTGIGCTNTPYTGFGANSTYLLNPNNNVLFALGTTSSKAVFDWFGGGYASSNILMTLTQPGYLGIGTTTPNHLLTISGSDTNTSLTSTNIVEENIINQNSSVNNNTADFALNTADTNGVVVTGSKFASVFTSHTPGAVSADLVFLTRNAGTLSEKLRITSTGNIIVSNFTGGTVNSGPAGTLYTSATTTATCTGNASCSPFTVFGSTPVAINVSAGTAASSTLLGDANTFSGNDTFNNLITGSISGNAGTATKFATGRTIAITGDLAYTSPSFDGSGNVTAAGTLATVNSNVGSFTNANITVNAKGLITAATNGTAGGVTTVTATYPILSSGGTTPVISTAFGTTSTWGLGNNGFVITGPTGIPFIAASSTLSLPNTALQNSSLTVNGISISLGGSGTVTANTTNALTFNNGGAGAVSGTTFNGGAAQTISYNTIGAQVAGTYVTSVSGTANQITSSGGTTPTLSLPNLVIFPNNASSTLFSTTYGSTTNDFIGTLTLPGLTGTQCLHEIGGTVSGTGSDCGSGSGGVTSVTGTYPVQSSGGTTPAISLAFGTTTANVWQNTQTFTVSPIFSTLGAGTVNSTAAGTIYNTATSTVSLGSGLTYTGTIGSEIGGVNGSLSVSGLTTTNFSSANISQWTNNSGYLTSAVTSAVAGTGIGVSSATGAVTFSNTGVTSIVAGTNITVSGATGAVTINASGSGGGAAYPFTPNTDNGINTSATSTPIQDTAVGLGLDVSAGGWYGVGGKLFAYASSTNRATILGLGAGGNNATTSATVGSTTAIGFNALSQLTSGLNNTAVGSGALLNTITSSQEVAVGAGALLKSTGSQNTGIGYLGGSGITTGSNNVAVGDNTLSASAGTTENTAIGSSALHFATGGFNTAVGFGAAQDNGAAGVRNTYVGFDAGSANGSGNGNILIGELVQLANASLNSQLNIGNVLFGTGLYDNASFTESSVATAAGRIGISTTTPLGRLSVMANSGDTNTNLFVIGSTTAAAVTSTLFQVLNTGQVFAPKLTASTAAQADTVCQAATGELISESVVCGSSARRYKYDIADDSPNKDLQEVMQLQPVTYLFKPDFNGGYQNDPNYSRQQLGLIADDALKINPAFVKVEVATTTFEGVIYAPGAPAGLDDEGILEATIGAIQAQQKEIEALTPTAKTAEDNWQWAAIALLVCWNITLTVKRRK